MRNLYIFTAQTKIFFRMQIFLADFFIPVKYTRVIVSRKRYYYFKNTLNWHGTN